MERVSSIKERWKGMRRCSRMASTVSSLADAQAGGRAPQRSVFICCRVHDPWCVDSALEVDQTVTDSFGDRLDAVRDLKLLIDVL